MEAKRRFRLWGRNDDAEEPSVGSVIGTPFNVQHVTSVKPDSHSSTGERHTACKAWRAVWVEGVLQPGKELRSIQFSMRCCVTIWVLL